MTPKKSGGWSSWLGLHPASTTSFSPAESQDEKKAMDHAVAVAKDVSPPDSDDDVFFDVEDVDLCTTSQPQQQASLKFPIWENNEEAVCADVENGSVSDSDPQEHDFFDPEELSVDDTTLYVVLKTPHKRDTQKLAFTRLQRAKARTPAPAGFHSAK